MRNPEPSPIAPPVSSKLLLLTAMLCGASVMEIEVLGSRVIGPYYGVSLYVWTSLIAVTLTSLAIGYWFGGALSDRRGRASELYGLIFMSGVSVLLIPWLKPLVEAVEKLETCGRNTILP